MITALASIPPRPEAAQPGAQALHRQLGVQGGGYVTRAELASALVKISPLGASRSSGDAHDDARAAFQRIDLNHDGRITAAEFLRGISLQRPALPAEADTDAAPAAPAATQAAAQSAGLARYAAVQSLGLAAGPGWH